MVREMDFQKKLNDLLQPGERVLWTARPDGWYYTRPTFMLYIAAVPWVVFTFFWLRTFTGGFQWPGQTVYPYPNWMPWVAIWTGIILLISGLWMLSAPYWVWRTGKRAFYVLTDRRALVVDYLVAKKNQTLLLEGPISFRITDIEEAVSDIEVLCGKSQGLRWRAVRDPKQILTLTQPETSQL